jgi:hypothetical protein
MQRRRRFQHAKTPAGVARPTETGSAAMGATDGARTGSARALAIAADGRCPDIRASAAGTNITRRPGSQDQGQRVIVTCSKTGGETNGSFDSRPTPGTHQETSHGASGEFIA